jgi:hypothetical protein
LVSPAWGWKWSERFFGKSTRSLWLLHAGWS